MLNTDDKNKNVSVIKQAAAWLARMQEKPLSPNELEALNQWKQQSTEHQMAWQRAEQFSKQLNIIPSQLGIQVLNRPANIDRRSLLKSLGIVVVAIPTGYISYKTLPWQSYLAEISTAPGEQRIVQLEDGGVINVNTKSSVDLAYTTNERLIHLYEGDIFIDTAKDVQNRPFWVQTVHGKLHALGTKFFVSQHGQQSYIGVLEGAVEVITNDEFAQKVTLKAGEQTTFNQFAIAPKTALDDTNTGWLDGVLYADNTPLKDVIATLSRYRSGVLRCDDAVANMPISGAFQLKNPEHILEVLQQTRPIQIVWRTRYWGTIIKK